jgi:hypothetical protein
MMMSLEFVVCQDRVVDWPCRITLGLAARTAVGAGGGGGVGGVDLATFLLQPNNNSIARKVTRKADTFNSFVFT